MWGRFLDYVRLLFRVIQESERNGAELRAIRSELDGLVDVVQQLRYDLEHLKDNERHEREKTLLRLENELLRFERRLPTFGKALRSDRTWPKAWQWADIEEASMRIDRMSGTTETTLARTPTAAELRELPAVERDAILRTQAEVAESFYRSDRQLTDFEAFGESDLYGDSSSAEAG